MVSKKGFQVCYGTHDQRVLWYHHKLDHLLRIFHRSLDNQEDDSFSSKLFKSCPLHLLIIVSLCPFLFGFFIKIYRFLLTFILVFLISQLKNHQHQDSFNLSYQVQMRIFDYPPSLLKNPPKVLIIVTTQSTLKAFLKYHLKLDVFNHTTLIQQSTIFVNQYFQALILWFVITSQDLLVSIKLHPRVTQEIVFNLICWVLSPQLKELDAVLILLEEIFLKIIFQEEFLYKDCHRVILVHHLEGWWIKDLTQ